MNNCGFWVTNISLIWTSHTWYTWHIYVPVLFMAIVAMKGRGVFILLLVHKCNSSITLSIKLIGTVVYLYGNILYPAAT